MKIIREKKVHVKFRDGVYHSFIHLSFKKYIYSAPGSGPIYLGLEH